MADHSVQDEDAELRNPNFIRDSHDWEGIKEVLSLMHHIPTENVCLGSQDAPQWLLTVSNKFLFKLFYKETGLDDFPTLLNNTF